MDVLNVVNWVVLKSKTSFILEFENSVIDRENGITLFDVLRSKFYLLK